MDDNSINGVISGGGFGYGGTVGVGARQSISADRHAGSAFYLCISGHAPISTDFFNSKFVLIIYILINCKRTNMFIM